MISRRLRYELAGRAVGPLLLALEGRRSRGRKRDAPGPFGPPLETTRRLKELMGVYYYQGRWADGAVPVAWVTSGFPVEVLRAHGFYCVYPENHAALCAARRLGPELSDVAEAEGYSRDLCAYARMDIGSVLSGQTPVGRIPKPDLVAACSNICQTVVYWFRAIADHLGVPFVLVDTPFVYGEAREHELDFVCDQLAELEAEAARIAGRPAGEIETRRVVELAWRASQLWGDCLATGRSRPSPWTAFDHFIHMAPIVALRGTEACLAYYRELHDELTDRARRGIGGVTDERHRLLWDNIAIWYRLRDLSRLFADDGFTFVCATYSSAWADSWRGFELDDRVRSTAAMLSGVLLNRDLPNRLRMMAELARDFSVDGVVLHSDRSCKPYSIGQYDLADRLREELGVKAVIIEADHADSRAYSAEQVETRVRAFMESF